MSEKNLVDLVNQLTDRVEFLEAQYKHLCEYLSHSGEYKHLEARVSNEFIEDLQ